MKRKFYIVPGAESPTLSWFVYSSDSQLVIRERLGSGPRVSL